MGVAAASTTQPAVPAGSAALASGSDYYYYEADEAAPPASPIDSARHGGSLPPSAPPSAAPAPSAAPPLTSTALTPEQENEYYSEYYSDAAESSAPSSIAGSLPRLNPPKAGKAVPAVPHLWNLSSAPASPRMQPQSLMAAAAGSSAFAAAVMGTASEAQLPDEIAALEAAQLDGTVRPPLLAAASGRPPPAPEAQPRAQGRSLERGEP